MEFDAGDLVTVELALDRDVVDVVVLDRGEHAAEVADDTVLPAVEDGVAAHDVGPDVLPVPADPAGGEHRLELVLVAGLVAAQGGEVVAGRDLLAERDRRALGVVDDVVLDDPALRPVRADQAGLVGGRRCPRSRGVGQFETGDGDVVEVVLDGVEHGSAHVDLDQLGVGIGTGEVCPDGGVIGAHLGMPDQPGLVRVPNRVESRRSSRRPSRFAVAGR